MNFEYPELQFQSLGAHNGCRSDQKTWLKPTKRLLFLVGTVLVAECQTVRSFSLSCPIHVAKKNPFSAPTRFCDTQPRHHFRSRSQGLPSLTPRGDFNLRVSLKSDEISVGSQQQSLKQLDQDEVAFDRLLDNDTSEINLTEAVAFLKSHPNLPLTKSRWFKIFQAIELRTALADESEAGVNTRQNRDALEQQQPLSSQARKEMTDMYQTLHQLEHLRLFGAVSTTPQPLNSDPLNAAVVPAMGSDQVSPSLLETVTGLSMISLTPRPTNSVLLAGAVLAVVELLTCLTTGISFNFLALMTLAAAFLDRLLVNGAVLESFVKILSPELQTKIVRHEAGHFLCAYLLGCPVEGCVLSAWAALQDARFGLRRNSVSAGTSFYDPILSQQIHNHISDRSNVGNNALMPPTSTGMVTKSSVNRYSIIVMAGIAAEAMQYGQADGGASDEFALISFLSQLNRRGNPVWNDVSVRNQARWGALQAILMLKHYKPCYDALVEVLERGGRLGECIYAIEKAAREANLTPLTQPFGYIVDRGGERQEWKVLSANDVVATDPLTSSPASDANGVSLPAVSKEESMEELAEYRKLVEQRLQEIDSKLDNRS
jgi:hypothetical protein